MLDQKSFPWKNANYFQGPSVGHLVSPVSHLALLDPAHNHDAQQTEYEDPQRESEDGKPGRLHLSQLVTKLIYQVSLELLLRAKGGGCPYPPCRPLGCDCGPHSGWQCRPVLSSVEGRRRLGRGHGRVARLRVGRLVGRLVGWLEVVLGILDTRPRLVVLRPRVLLVARPEVGRWVHVRSEVTVGREGGRRRTELGILVTAVFALRDPIARVVGGDTLPRPAPELVLAALLHPVPQVRQLLAVAQALVAGGQVELVSVNIQHCGAELKVGGKLALDVLQGAAVEQVAATPVRRVWPGVVHRRVTQGVGAAVVQTPGKAGGWRLIEEDSPTSNTVLRPDDGVRLHLVMPLAVVVNVVIVDGGSLEVTVLAAGGVGGDQHDGDHQEDLHVSSASCQSLSAASLSLPATSQKESRLQLALTRSTQY